MASETSQSRRSTLKKLIIIGAGVAVAASGGLSYFLTRKQTISINVKYVGMTYVVQQTSEIVKLTAPAKLSDLEDILWETHPALQTMEDMQVLVNGTSPFGDPSLKNEDEVDFIALMAGG